MAETGLGLFKPSHTASPSHRLTGATARDGAMVARRVYRWRNSKIGVVSLSTQPSQPVLTYIQQLFNLIRAVNSVTIRVGIN